MPGVAVRYASGIAAALLLASGSARAEWILREESIMGTRCAVELWSEDRAAGEASVTAVFDEFRRVDRLMSTYKPDSELSRVNAGAAKAPVRVSRELYDLLATSIEYSKLTRGAFDITYASVGYLYDYRAGVHPDDAAIAKALPGINWRHLQLQPKSLSVRFTRPGTLPVYTTVEVTVDPRRNPGAEAIQAAVRAMFTPLTAAARVRRAAIICAALDVPGVTNVLNVKLGATPTGATPVPVYAADVVVPARKRATSPSNSYVAVPGV